MPAIKLNSIVQALQQLRYSEAALVTRMHRSLPIGFVDGGKFRAGVMYARCEIVTPKQGLQLWPPSYVAYVDLVAGRLDALRAVTPRDFGRDDDPEKPLGACPPPAEKLAPAVAETTARYYASWDSVMAEFAATFAAPRPTASARDFMKLFQDLSEPPLAPYYQAFSPQFFAWSKKASS